MDKSNFIKFSNKDEVNGEFKNTSGWFKKVQSSDSNSNREKDKHPILRIKNVDDKNDIAGVIRFNDEKAVFQGCVGSNNWTDFNVSQGSNGLDGLNYKTEIKGSNLFTTGDNYYPLFKNVIKDVTIDETIVLPEEEIDSQLEEIVHRLPVFKYDSTYTSKKFDLAGHNIIFEPKDNTSYTVKVRNNPSYPLTDYSKHSKYSTINNSVKLSNNGYIFKSLNTKFKFYDTEYEEIYINENGYITFGTGESSYIQNLLQNHFSKKRISALFLNLSPLDLTSSDIFIGTGIYGELVITFQNYIHNTNTENIRTDFQIRLFLNGVGIDSNGLYSDDYYKKGTIQISYNNNSDFSKISPLIGLSDGSGYDSTIFNELYYSKLKTNSIWDESKGTGIPFLNTFLSLGINSSETSSISNLKAKFPDNLTNNETGNIFRYKLLLDDIENVTIYETSYKEDNYYIKILNLGDIKLTNLGIAIRSIYDYESKKNLSVQHYSDSTNYFIDNDGSTEINNIELDNKWLDIPQEKLIVLDFNNSTKDFLNIYDNITDTEINTNYKQNLYNSKIYRIQASYENILDSNFEIGNKKNLLIKIIYTLNSDFDLVLNSSLSSATPIIFNRDSGGNNYGPYQYLQNNIEYFSITRNGSLVEEANFDIQIYCNVMEIYLNSIGDLYL